MKTIQMPQNDCNLQRCPTNPPLAPPIPDSEGDDWFNRRPCIRCKKPNKLGGTWCADCHVDVMTEMYINCEQEGGHVRAEHIRSQEKLNLLETKDIPIDIRAILETCEL